MTEHGPQPSGLLRLCRSLDKRSGHAKRCPKRLRREQDIPGWKEAWVLRNCFTGSLHSTQNKSFWRMGLIQTAWRIFGIADRLTGIAKAVVKVWFFLALALSKSVWN